MIIKEESEEYLNWTHVMMKIYIFVSKQEKTDKNITREVKGEAWV
jgi:hypothetical protein